MSDPHPGDTRKVSPRRRRAAVVALVAFAAATVLAVAIAVSSFPKGPVVALLLVASTALVLMGLLRRGRVSTAMVAIGAVVLVAALVALARGRVLVEAIAATALVATGMAGARTALRRRAHLPRMPAPRRPVMLWNPRSGGGAAAAADLGGEARRRGIEVVELGGGKDLLELAEQAVAGGADALSAAGGDGTQAVVAEVAARHDLPFACIPAGTRNHFALDLGVDRDDLIGSLDALVDGRERVVDMGEVNGRPFVNNVSLGAYAEAVQQDGYRDAKVQTLLSVLPAASEPGEGQEMHWKGPEGETYESASVLLVSNNQYRLAAFGAGTRPSLEDGMLGVLALNAVPADGRPRLASAVMAWTTAELEVDCGPGGGPVAVGIDGEGVSLDAPVVVGIRPGVLRVRIARRHPGASPSAGLGRSPGGLLRALWEVAAGRTGSPS